MHKVLVYGSLKRGKHNHVLLERSEFLGVKWTDDMFKMYDTGGFPYLLWGTNSVLAELYEVNDATLRRLDHLEGISIDHYQRIETQWYDGNEGTGWAWLYIATESTAEFVREYYQEVKPTQKYDQLLLEWK